MEWGRKLEQTHRVTKSIYKILMNVAHVRLEPMTPRIPLLSEGCNMRTHLQRRPSNLYVFGTGRKLEQTHRSAERIYLIQIIIALVGLEPVTPRLENKVPTIK